MTRLRGFVRHFTVRLWFTVFRARLKKRGVLFKLGKMAHFSGVPIFIFEEQSKVQIGDNVTFLSDTRANMSGVYKACSIAVGPNACLEIGNSCGFSGVSIVCRERITIGDNLTCGSNVSIWDTDFHPMDHLRRRNDCAKELSYIAKRPIHIGRDVFIGGQSIILKGVRIGDRAIVAAGSVLTKEIGPDEIWGGNPAVFIRKTTE